MAAATLTSAIEITIEQLLDVMATDGPETASYALAGCAQWLDQEYGPDWHRSHEAIVILGIRHRPRNRTDHLRAAANGGGTLRHLAVGHGVVLDADGLRPPGDLFRRHAALHDGIFDGTIVGTLRWAEQPREREVPCRSCGRGTWNTSAYCNRCGVTA